MRILSGITASAECHIGNYFGAIRQHVALQDEGEGIYFMADYHSMNTVRGAVERRRLVREIALDYLACGLDPERAVLYRQSDFPELCELGHRFCFELANDDALGPVIGLVCEGGFLLGELGIARQVVSLRLTAAAAAIIELSKAQQVLFFTCHPETIEIFRSIDPGINEHTIEDGRLV